MNDFLKPLGSIQKAEVPPYLLTRIHQRIKNDLSNQFSYNTIWAIGFSFGVLVVINILVLPGIIGNTTNSEIISQMHLLSENSLY